MWPRIKRILKILVFTLLSYHPPPCIPPRSSIGTRGYSNYPGSTFCSNITSTVAKYSGCSWYTSHHEAPMLSRGSAQSHPCITWWHQQWLHALEFEVSCNVWFEYDCSLRLTIWWQREIQRHKSLNQTCTGTIMCTDNTTLESIWNAFARQEWTEVFCRNWTLMKVVGLKKMPVVDRRFQKSQTASFLLSQVSSCHSVWVMKIMLVAVSIPFKHSLGCRKTLK
jgi:hypothetical protein